MKINLEKIYKNIEELKKDETYVYQEIEKIKKEGIIEYKQLNKNVQLELLDKIGKIGAYYSASEVNNIKIEYIIENMRKIKSLVNDFYSFYFGDEESLQKRRIKIKARKDFSEINQNKENVEDIEKNILNFINQNKQYLKNIKELSVIDNQIKEISLEIAENFEYEDYYIPDNIYDGVDIKIEQEILGEGLRYIDENLWKEYIKLIKEERINILSRKKFDSNCKYYEKGYVFIEEENNMMRISTIIHELSHYFDYVLNGRKPINISKKKTINEFKAVLLEFVFFEIIKIKKEKFDLRFGKELIDNYILAFKKKMLNRTLSMLIKCEFLEALIELTESKTEKNIYEILEEISKKYIKKDIKKGKELYYLEAIINKGTGVEYLQSYIYSINIVKNKEMQELQEIYKTYIKIDDIEEVRKEKKINIKDFVNYFK